MGDRLEKHSRLIRKHIECHTYEDEGSEEYEASKFGGLSDYFRRKRLKLQNLDIQIRSNSVNKPQIFRGIVVHVNGYTQPSLTDIHHLVVSHGGGFMQYLDGKTTVTHIIAANLTPKKVIEFQRYRIVKPAWIVDSIASGRMLSWTTYNVLNDGSAQQQLKVEDGKVINQVKTNIKSYREQTKMSWYTGDVKKVIDDIVEESTPRSTRSWAVERDKIEDKDLKFEKTRETSPVILDNEFENDSLLSGSFEVTSSLENALDDIKTLDGQNESAIIKMSTQTSSSPINKHKKTLLPRKSNAPILNDRAPGLNFELNKINKSVEGNNTCHVNNLKEMTAEEHNALLLANPSIRKSTTANPDFINQFYSESRLHHLSTWKAELKSRLQKMMAAQKSSHHAQPTIKQSGSRRYIIHVDFDCFFCAVSLKNYPHFVDKPAAVAHGNGPSAEIASCNYPAREFGVKNGMSMKNAIKICPQIKVLPYDFPAYKATSNHFYQVILNLGGVVQILSVDEALIDITSLCQTFALGETNDLATVGGNSLREQEKACKIAFDIRQKVKLETGCDVSVGIGPNILLAKAALRTAKPSGQYQIKPEEALNFIGGFGVRDLPGVAHSIGGKLEENGIMFVKDIRKLSKERLMKLLGPRTGVKIWEFSHGNDRAEVGEQVGRKSVSAEVNWGIRFISQFEAEEFVQNLCVELQRRLIDQNVRGRQLTMKIMKRSAGAPLDPPKHLGHGTCDTFNKSIVFGVPTTDAKLIGREAVSILRSYRFSPGDLRGLGIQMTKLEPMKSNSPISSAINSEGCQKQINFRKSGWPKKVPQPLNDPIDDSEVSSLPKTMISQAKEKIGSHCNESLVNHSTFSKIQNCRTPGFLSNKEDPINENCRQEMRKNPTTPVRHHPASVISRINSADLSFSPKPLNITGTQFIIPSQIDDHVLGELPQDLRSKLIAQSKNQAAKKNVLQNFQQPKPLDLTFSNEVPLPSQLDPGVFTALPDEIKAEVLASYRTDVPAQTHLPHTPPRVDPLRKMMTKKLSPLKKRGRSRRLVGPKTRNEPQQSNILNLRDHSIACKTGADGDSQDLGALRVDAEFLSALPDDVRHELLSEQRRQQQQQQRNFKTRLGGIKPLINNKGGTDTEVPPIQRKIVLPQREPRPTFTTQELSSLSQLRKTTSAWYEEFSSEGPYPEDVSALVRYLRRVVLDERDLSKAESLVRWLGYLIAENNNYNSNNNNNNDDDDSISKGLKSWIMAYENIKEGVQLAVQERGLGRLEF